MKLRGVPESILNAQLNQYACDLIQAVLPSIPISEIIIDRIHRLPKPAYLPDDIPCDVIMRVHFYHVKDQFMSNFRKAKHLPEGFSHLQIYADLSQFTLQKRKSLSTITKALRNHNITYRWGYPVKLTITYNDTTSVITTLTDGLALLCSWDILPEQENPRSSPPKGLNNHEKWQVVSHKHKPKSQTRSPLTSSLATTTFSDLPSSMAL